MTCASGATLRAMSASCVVVATTCGLAGRRRRRRRSRRANSEQTRAGPSASSASAYRNSFPFDGSGCPQDCVHRPETLRSRPCCVAPSDGRHPPPSPGARRGRLRRAASSPPPRSPSDTGPALFELPLPHRPASDAGARRRSIQAPQRFDLVGLRWASGHAQAQVRARAHGERWTRWTALPHPHGPHVSGTDPAFTGAADELQFRLRGNATQLKARFVRALPHAPASRRPAPRRRACPRSSRATAGAPTRSRPAARPSYGTVQIAFVHHTAGTIEYAPEDSPGIVLGIARYHRDSNRWNDIGYNFLVDRYGVDLRGPRGRHRPGGRRRAGAGLQQLQHGDRDARDVHRAPARRARDGVARQADRLEAEPPRRAHQRAGDADLRRRREQPLPERHAGHLRAHQRPPRRRPDHLPRRRALRAAPGPPSAEPPATRRRSARSRSRPPASRARRRSASPAHMRFADGSIARGRAAGRRVRRARTRRLRAGHARAPPASTARWTTSVVLPASGKVRAVFAGDGTRPRLESAPVDGQGRPEPGDHDGQAARHGRHRVRGHRHARPRRRRRSSACSRSRSRGRWVTVQRKRIAVAPDPHRHEGAGRRHAGLYRVSIIADGVTRRRTLRALH